MKINGKEYDFANLSGVDLSGADLRGFDLRGCNLSGSDLSNCNLSGCNLSGCNLNGTNLYNVTLKNAYLANAYFTNDNTKICLGTDFRGYRFVAIASLKDWMILAGCRWFTLEKAKSHWASNLDALNRIKICEEIPCCAS